MFDFVATEDFRDDLNTFENDERNFIKQKIAYFSCLENPLHFAKKLKGHNGVYRFRAGDYRIVFRLSGTHIVLLAVGHRKDIYQGLT